MILEKGKQARKITYIQGEETKLKSAG